jgi:hypothetical protein
MKTLHAVVMWICLLCPALFSYTLTIAKAGNGDGQVRVNGVLHDLPYSENFAGGVDVTVRAFPASGSRFDHWSWSTSTKTDNPITLPMPNQNIVVYAHFNILYTLSIINSGPGGGQVIANGGTYSLPVVLVFDEGTTVTLEVVDDDTSLFTNWSGDLGGSVNPTNIVMNTNKSVQVNFKQCTEYPRGLWIGSAFLNWIDNDNDGVGQYAIIKQDFGFSIFMCPTYKLRVHFTWAPVGATHAWGEQWFPESGYYEISPVNNSLSFLLDDQFLSQISKLDSARWEIKYTITYSSGLYHDSSFEAVFESEIMDNPLWHSLYIAKTGSGSGKVKVNSSVRVLPYGQQAHEGTPFHLAAIPDSGSVFAEWSGAVTSPDPTIDVTLDTDKNLTATFNLSQTTTLTLNITKYGTGNGQVKVNNVLRNLPYSEQAAEGTAFSLEAVPSSGSVFAGWSGAATGSNPSINLTMNSDKNLDAAFSIVNQDTCRDDIVIFDESPTGNAYYDESWAYSISPSFLETLNEGRLPVDIQHPFQGNHSIRLRWNSKPGGDWGIAIADVNWGEHDVSQYDSIHYWVNGPRTISKSAVPDIAIQDILNKISTRAWLGDYFQGVDGDSTTWQEVGVPLNAFQPGAQNCDFTRIKTIYHFQKNADGVEHTAWLDEIRFVTKCPAITFHVTVPGNPPSPDVVYLAGDFNYWDPGPDEAGTDGVHHDLAMHKTGTNAWELSLPDLGSRQIKYKYTRGSWSRREWDSGGKDVDDRVLQVPETSHTQNDVVAAWSDMSTGVNEKEGRTERGFELGQNYPNPFNPTTMIPFEVRESCRVVLEVYDVRGRDVSSVVDSYYAPGAYRVLLDASGFAPGIYLYCIEMGNFRAMRKMVVVE